jgi:hypothetical protein
MGWVIVSLLERGLSAHATAVAQAALERAPGHCDHAITVEHFESLAGQCDGGCDDGRTAARCPEDLSSVETSMISLRWLHDMLAECSSCTTAVRLGWHAYTNGDGYRCFIHALARFYGGIVRHAPQTSLV